MSTQRMFNGSITADALVDQLAARFNETHYRTQVNHGNETALIQIGSQHGSPLTINVADTSGGVLVTMSSEHNWLDRASDVSERIERAASGNLVSLLSMVPDVLAEMKKDNLAPAIWDAVNDICSLTRALAGEKNAPANPKVCLFCQTANPPENELCMACGAALPMDWPRVCPKCGRGHTSDALFCQALRHTLDSRIRIGLLKRWTGVELFYSAPPDDNIALLLPAVNFRTRLADDSGLIIWNC